MARITTIRLSDREHERLVAAAEAAGQSQSSYIRLACEHEIERSKETRRWQELNDQIAQLPNSIADTLLRRLKPPAGASIFDEPGASDLMETHETFAAEREAIRSQPASGLRSNRLIILLAIVTAALAFAFWRAGPARSPIHPATPRPAATTHGRQY